MPLKIPDVDRMDQELFQSAKTFLRTEKGCSNIESEVPVEEKSYNRLEIKGVGIIPPPICFGHIAVVGGKFYKKNPEDLRYIGIELHCIEYISPSDDIVRGVGQISWHRFGMSNLDTWAEQLFFYLMVHEDRISEAIKGFCTNFGLGLLQVNTTKIVTEIVAPDNQHGFLGEQARDKIMVECQQCGKSFAPKELTCPDCDTPLAAKTPRFRHLFADEFRASSTVQKYQGVPDRIPEEVKKTPMLEKVFRNWSNVKKDWRA